MNIQNRNVDYNVDNLTDDVEIRKLIHEIEVSMRNAFVEMEHLQLSVQQDQNFFNNTRNHTALVRIKRLRQAILLIENEINELDTDARQYLLFIPRVANDGRGIKRRRLMRK
jgi:hypothetical protein